MEDTSFMPNNLNDLVIFNQVMLKFEAQSGAILSRDKKTKVMGLGKWQGRENWPREVHWIKTVTHMGGFTEGGK